MRLTGLYTLFTAINLPLILSMLSLKMNVPFSLVGVFLALVTAIYLVPAATGAPRSIFERGEAMGLKSGTLRLVLGASAAIAFFPIATRLGEPLAKTAGVILMVCSGILFMIAIARVGLTTPD